jgi:heptosyltransferase-1
MSGPLLAVAPRRVRVVRLSAIGAVVRARRPVTALRRAWPEARSAWLAEPFAAEILAAHPDLDAFIPWPRREWQELWRTRRYPALARQVAAFARALRRERFDLVLDTQGLLKSGVLTWLTRAPVRVGLGSREGSARLMTAVVDRRTESRRIGAEYLKLARALGLPADPFPMRVAPRPEAREEAGRALAAAGVPASYGVLLPFTTRPQKHWVEDRWRPLARVITGEYGLTPVLLGGPGDREAAARIATGGGVADLCGRLSLGGSAAVIQGASLAVGVDTGLTHMAIAAGVPTVALFGSTRPYLETGSPRARVLYEPLPCSPCKRRPTCGGRFDCMAAHTVAHVVATGGDVLEARA